LQRIPFMSLPQRGEEMERVGLDEKPTPVSLSHREREKDTGIRSALQVVL